MYARPDTGSNGTSAVALLESLTSLTKRVPGRRVSPPCGKQIRLRPREMPDPYFSKSVRASMRGENSPALDEERNGAAFGIYCGQLAQSLRQRPRRERAHEPSGRLSG